MSEPGGLIEVARDGQIATITMHRLRNFGPEQAPTGRSHRAGEIADALEELRKDNSVRVVILTGEGDAFTAPPSDAPWHGNPSVDWDLMSGLTRALQAITEIEKPVIAKVNGQAIGFGSSLVFGSDFIVAREDAVLADHHLAMGEVMINGEVRNTQPKGIVPGDGGSVFVPLAMPPTMAKEYLMLAKSYTAAELCRLGIVNYAVPAAELDTVTDDLARRLLARNAYALAWSKRVINQRQRNAVMVTHDAALSYEFLGFYMQTDEARARGGEHGISEL